MDIIQLPDKSFAATPRSGMTKLAAAAPQSSLSGDGSRSLFQRSQCLSAARHPEEIGLPRLVCVEQCSTKASPTSEPLQLICCPHPCVHLHLALSRVTHSIYYAALHTPTSKRKPLQYPWSRPLNVGLSSSREADKAQSHVRMPKIHFLGFWSLVPSSRSV